MNEIICHKQLQNNCISLITDEQNCKITDKTKISDMLNDYFANVEPSLAAKIPAATKFFNFPSMLKSFVYDPMTENEVYYFFTLILRSSWTTVFIIPSLETQLRFYARLCHDTWHTVLKWEYGSLD